MESIDPLKIKMNTDNLEQNKPRQRNPRFSPGEKFLAGPIPMSWLSRVASLPGKALNVGLAIWFLKQVMKSNTVALSGKTLQDFGVKRRSGYRGLIALEQAGIVSCLRCSGRSPRVTLLFGETDKNWNRKDCDMSGDPE
jgi:hypothetical protein